MQVRPAKHDDKPAWLRMRTALWPESPGDHEPELTAYFAGESPIAAVFVVERPDGRLAGFLECGVRAYAEGCATSPVGYIEAWWVDPDVRGRGLGALLVSAAEDWARSRGYSEMASDADLYNEVSQLAHQRLGYEETQRLVCYRKQL
jgi:aminoglycoside 6'-N-acetyltransferase I